MQQVTMTSTMCRWLLPLLVLVVLLEPPGAWSQSMVDLQSTLECHRRPYSYRVTKTDSAGRRCWDTINVMSCWGRCDSNEIADWKFPYKSAHHPVCLHDVRQTRVLRLQNCDEGVEPGTDRYEYLEAVSCRCMECKSSQASCEGLRYRGQRSGGYAGLTGR